MNELVREHPRAGVFVNRVAREQGTVFVNRVVHEQYAGEQCVREQGCS